MPNSENFSDAFLTVLGTECTDCAELPEAVNRANSSCGMHAGHSAVALPIHSDLLSFHTSTCMGPVARWVCLHSLHAWGSHWPQQQLCWVYCPVRSAVLFLAACGVFCIGWLMATCTCMCTVLGTGQPVSAGNTYTQSFICQNGKNRFHLGSICCLSLLFAVLWERVWFY